LPETQPLHQ